MEVQIRLLVRILGNRMIDKCVIKYRRQVQTHTTVGFISPGVGELPL